MNIAQPAQAARHFREIALSLLKRLFGETKQREALQPLYRAIVAAGRDPAWYRQSEVPDTIDGRFDILTALTALVLLRLEAEGEAGKGPSVLLTELFIDDMEGTLRQIGIGDYVVGKHLGKMVGALGGRLAAFREAEPKSEAFAAAVRRNVFHENPPSEGSVSEVSDRLEAFRSRLAQSGFEALMRGEL